MVSGPVVFSGLVITVLVGVGVLVGSLLTSWFHLRWAWRGKCWVPEHTRAPGDPYCYWCRGEAGHESDDCPVQARRGTRD